MSFIQALVLAVLEGVTEFLPVSSTGHLIIGSSLFGIAGRDFTKLFTVAIQFGAILSVVVLYWRRFVQSFDFYLKLLVAFIPAVIIGKLLARQIDLLLGNVVVVAASLFLGGLFFIFADRWFQNSKRDELPTRLEALFIGFFQVIAMIPGVSRSAATIIGGLSQGLSRKAAAEFSFFLAVPTMLAAAVYKLYEFQRETGGLMPGELPILLFGNLVAFIVACLAIRSFIGFLNRHGFRLFGYYRIAVGAVVLVLYFTGKMSHSL